MKKSVFRFAAVGAVAALIASIAPLSAQAATTPAYDTTTNGPVYLVNGTSYAQVTAGTQIDWNTAEGIVLSATPVPADLGDYSWAAFPAPTGTAVQYTSFLSPVGSERTPSAWKEWGDFSAINGGASLPSVWPGNFGFGTPAAVKAAGGTYSMGIAYTDSAIVASTNVVKAYYTTINVDAGTGTWTFASPPVAVVTTDVPTTTTLAALPTSVEAGQSTVLTATVSASKTVTGNVQFFEGAVQIGSGALASGTATKTVTVGTAGSHTYSAKFVENTVGTDKFLASTSGDVTVTATVAAVALPPNAPTESALNTNTAQGATASYDAVTHKATLTVDAGNNGKTVNAFVYSTPTYLGQLTVTGGTITVDVSTLALGVHKLAIVDPTSGDVLAWASFTKSDAAIVPTITKTINADVAGQTLADGEFSLTNLSGDTVNLTSPALVNGASVVSGQLGSFKVTDLRQASTPGWTLKTDVAQFAKGTDTIAASALGIAPVVVSQAGTGATAPTLGAAQVSGSASYPWNFATLAASKFSGVSTYNADLVFTAPASSPAGTYTSTLTLTLISN
ncbi:MAG TPA: Ig-like domain-containing protein [Propionicimonas sp.]|jgi:hypothetical protein|uniref:Ig-like domain-containing protein n=1 Tax=Propionicimonas sp. TaxID=1955623 RepID=UPI002F3FBFAC